VPASAGLTTPEELLRCIRRGECHVGGDQGSAEKWAHVALALAARALCGDGDQCAPPPDPRMVWTLVQRAGSDGRARGGAALDVDLHPHHARALLEMWVASLGLAPDPRALLARMQADEFRHEQLARRARRAHERLLADATGEVVAAVEAGTGYARAASAVFGALVPAIPYAPASAFLAGEKRTLAAGDGGPRRVAVIADGLAGVHGVTRTLDQLRDRGVAGFEVEVIGTDANVDRRLPAAAEVDVPFYPGLRVGVPSVPATVEALADGRYDLVHLCSPGPAGVAAALIARTMELPLIGSYHTELGIYAGLRSGEVWLRASMDTALASLYDQCRVVLSPSEFADASVRALGIDPDRVMRWDRGVDTELFRPEQREEGVLPGELTVLYAGRLAREKGLDLLADAFLEAHAHDPRLHLVLAGDGPERDLLADRLGAHATFLGSLGDDALSLAYASADIFLFPSSTDTFGQVVLEAQASGLPIIAVGEGGPASLIDDGRTGRLCAPDAGALAYALCELADSPILRRRLADTALVEVRERSWERAFARLADGYRRALRVDAGGASATAAHAA
jgi:glycosyltransferase involved in cell wall biosynthesis